MLEGSAYRAWDNLADLRGRSLLLEACLLPWSFWYIMLQKGSGQPGVCSGSAEVRHFLVSFYWAYAMVLKHVDTDLREHFHPAELPY